MNIKLHKIFEQAKRRAPVAEADYYNDQDQPFWGNYGAGVLAVADSTKRILVSYRSADVNEPHTWGIVGGRIDDEASMDVKKECEREFKEETGYSGAIKLIPAYVFRTQGFTYYNFIGQINEEFDPILDWETERFEWMTFDQLLKLPKKHFGLQNLLNDTKSLNILKKLCGNTTNK